MKTAIAAGLFKDAQNHLLFFVQDKYVFFVDHYTAVDSHNTQFRLVGKQYEILDTKNGKRNFLSPAIYETFTPQYRTAITNLLATKIELFQTFLIKKIRWSLVALNVVIRLFSLGLLRVNPRIMVCYAITPVPILIGREAVDTEVVIDSIFFDHLMRVKNVKNTVIDFDAIWKEVASSSTSSPAVVSGAETNPPSSTL